jgi:hypothetical protein
MDRSKEILAFAHIEKTAGTTVSRRLKILLGSHPFGYKTLETQDAQAFSQ